jgi:hypothetical protein
MQQRTSAQRSVGEPNQAQEKEAAGKLTRSAMGAPSGNHAAALERADRHGGQRGGERINDWHPSTLLSAMGIDGDSEGSNAVGQSLPEDVRIKMEQALSADFSKVRIHTESRAAVAMGARAFTRGTEIYIAPGQYDPHGASGQELLGHELVHVTQQARGQVSSAHGAAHALDDDPQLEHEADTLGAHAARVQTTGPTSLDTSPQPGALDSGAAAGSSAVQRKLIVGDKEYDSNSSQEEVNKLWEQVKNFLPALRFRKAMFGLMLEDEEHTFQVKTIKDLAKEIEGVWQDDRAGRQGVPRPAWSKKVKEMVKVKKGKHRRHIVASSRMRDALIAYHQGSSKEKQKRFERGQKFCDENQKCRPQTVGGVIVSAHAWAHNRIENLFVEDGGVNTAIGFLFKPLYKIADELRESAQSSDPKEAIQKAIDEVEAKDGKIFNYAKDHHSSVLEVVLNSLDELTKEDEPRPEVAAELLEDFAFSCSFDIPYGADRLGCSESVVQGLLSIAMELEGIIRGGEGDVYAIFERISKVPQASDNDDSTSSKDSSTSEASGDEGDLDENQKADDDASDEDSKESDGEDDADGVDEMSGSAQGEEGDEDSDDVGEKQETDDDTSHEDRDENDGEEDAKVVSKRRLGGKGKEVVKDSDDEDEEGSEKSQIVESDKEQGEEPSDKKSKADEHLARNGNDSMPSVPLRPTKKSAGEQDREIKNALAWYAEQFEVPEGFTDETEKLCRYNAVELCYVASGVALAQKEAVAVLLIAKRMTDKKRREVYNAICHAKGKPWLGKGRAAFKRMKAKQALPRETT